MARELLPLKLKAEMIAMTTMTEAVKVPTWTPPKWVNKLMELMLRTPGLQRWIGHSIALISVTGRRSGKTYTTPVTYYRDGDAIIIITKTFRKWWRNLAEKPEVELRLQGQTLRGHARATIGDTSELPTFVRFLENRPMDAKAYGVTFLPDGHVNEEEARRVLEHLVLIRITLDGLRRPGVGA